MACEIAVRSLSPVLWAVIVSTITLLMAIIGLAAVILTAAGSLREEIRSVGAGLDDVEIGLSAEGEQSEATQAL